MNRKFETLNREELHYESPSVAVVDIHSEGLLCVSGDIDPDDWKDGQNNWFEE